MEIGQDLRFYYRRQVRERKGRYLKLNPRYLETLDRFFPYYQRLSATDKARFQHRMVLFMRSKKFIARGELKKVTPEMKTLISATAVMLSMGLPLVTFESFPKILIYPTDYYSKINKTHHKGEVNPKQGIIVLSWEHFVKGFMDAEDGINLGVHELAHALHFEDRIRNREYNYFPAGLLGYWRDHAVDEMDRIAAGEDHLFRPYAAANAEEFFAISLENFFERTAEFRDDLPQLYNIMVKLLQQDPSVEPVHFPD